MSPRVRQKRDEAPSTEQAAPRPPARRPRAPRREYRVVVVSTPPSDEAVDALRRWLAQRAGR